MKDPIVEEVREARRKHAEQFSFDLHSICLDLKQKEKNYSLIGLKSEKAHLQISNGISFCKV